MKAGLIVLRFIVVWILTLDLMAQSKIQSGPLEELVRQAKAQRSNALFVNEGGNPVREEFFDSKDRRIYVFSVTKLFSGLAVGLAWDRQLIPSIEEPVARYFPGASKDPRFEKIRIRHLLQHTSGIETTQGSKDIYPQKDFVRFALQSPIISEPGEVYHDGDLGNYLIVLPDDGIAVVRTIDQKRGRSGPHGFEEIHGLSARLVAP